jgi:MoaA/NifB/PqqE/SkfB family radical SAM enzyme
MSTKIVDHNQLYRMPWTLPDNGISWLEPTAECNLACDGCYRENVKESHKSFALPGNSRIGG